MNEKCYALGSQRSVIRELFEFSKSLKEKVGEDNVFDFSIGNPSVPTNPVVDSTIIGLLSSGDSTPIHGYTSAQGDKETRAAIAADLNARFGTNYDSEMLYMTCGAASSLISTFKAIKDSDDDEIIGIAPYFPEYKVFVEAVGSKFVAADADLEKFEINFDSLLEKINPHTKAVIVDSPNNPTGAIYSEETLKKLANILLLKSKEYGHPIYIIADEPYREIAYDGKVVPHIPSIYDNTIICYSYSKSLSLPGERIGYVLVPPMVSESKKLYLAVCGAGRSLGYVCAPSLMQKVIAKCANLTGDINEYRENRDLLYGGLTEIGYECVYPAGAFYLFVKSPDPDAVAFMELAKKHNLVLVPSDGFGVKGYLRLAYCTSRKTIVGSMPRFKALLEEYRAISSK